MSKYIELEDIKSALIELAKSKKWLGRETITSIVNALINLPTIDIVRCGECKCCRDELIEEHMPLYIYCEKWNHETDFDGFCKYGERKDYE